MTRLPTLFIVSTILLGYSILEATPRKAWVRISLSSQTLRLHPGDGPDRLYPVAVGRRRGGRRLGPTGRWYAGPDPRDTTFFIDSRKEPAFYEGLPQLRLTPVKLQGRRDPAYVRAAQHPFFIHGKVTPSLIWGAVTAGCVRLPSAALRRVYALAQRSISLPVTFSEAPDPLPAKTGAACSEASTGARRLRVLRYGRRVHGRLCGGVDHWFSVELQGGDMLAISLDQTGDVAMELYGIRAISAVARGKHALRHRVPMAAHNRGARYLRLVAPTRGVTASYLLEAQRLR